MRKALMACLIGLIALNGAVVISDALAQQRGQQSSSKGKGKTRPPPPPPPRCADLGVGTVAYMTAIPGEAPLGAEEVAVSWQVRNDGNAPFVAQTVADTSVALEFTTAAGPTRIAIAPAITTLNEDGRVFLAFNHGVRGVLRGVIPAEAAGRRLRLRLVYSSEGTRRGIPDCNESNNTAPVPPRPVATPVNAPAPNGR